MLRTVLSASTPLLIRTSQEPTKAKDPRVQKIALLFEDEPQRQFTLDELSQLVNLTPEHLCRIFKHEMGLAPLRHLKWRRLQVARKLLETSYLTVKQISHKAGFGDDSHFVRDFENRFGLSPCRYRALHRSVGPTWNVQPGEMSKSANKYQNPPIQMS